MAETCVSLFDHSHSLSYLLVLSIAACTSCWPGCIYVSFSLPLINVPSDNLVEFFPALTPSPLACATPSDTILPQHF